MAVRLKDVAARAGVSPVVVSHVLHDRAAGIRVSAATAERVRVAARDMGYRCNVLARSFRSQRTGMIGVLHGVGFARPYFNKGSSYFAALMDGLVEGAFRHGYCVTLCPKLLGQSPEDAMSDGRFDGLVWYSTCPSDENRAMLLRGAVPLVLVHTPSRDLERRYPSVICDNDQGVGEAVRHLLGLGHQRIAFAYEEDFLSGEAAMRREAFVRHMSRAGLEVGPRDLLDFRVDRSGIAPYLASGPRHTAIVALNDDLAVEILRRAPNCGVKIPEDLSVVGFDSTNFCDMQRPPLTSVSQPLTALGERAIDLLMASMSDDAGEPPEVILPCGFDVRGSTTTAPS